MRGGGLSAEALTEKDKQDIVTAARLGADYVAVSFVRTAEDMHTARRLLKEAGSEAGLVAKIERAELALSQADAAVRRVRVRARRSSACHEPRRQQSHVL